MNGREYELFSEKMKSILDGKGVNASETDVQRFYKYYRMLVEGNAKMNLTAIDDLEGVVKRHFEDSLLPFFNGLVGTGLRCADIGSGAGFPGIPLAIMCKESTFVLMDSLGKRVNFLNEVISELGLENCSAVCIRAEDAARLPEYREQFDAVFSRAVAGLNVLCELSLPLVKTGGRMIALKSVSVKEELEEAATAISVLGGKTEGVYGSDERNAAVISKISATPGKYPRRAGIPEKRPLGSGK